MNQARLARLEKSQNPKSTNSAFETCILPPSDAAITRPSTKYKTVPYPIFNTDENAQKAVGSRAVAYTLPMCTFRHLKDLGVVPQPRKVHVPSDTSRTWKWSPTLKMLSSMNSSNVKRNGFWRIPPKPRFDYCCTIFLFLHQRDK